jgi:hypothetical protein
MTGIKCSTSFGGKPWAVATFADGNSFAYWGSDYVPAFRNGRVLQDNTTTAQTRNRFIAAQLRGQLAAFSPDVFSVGALTASGTGYYFDFSSVPSYPYSVVATAFSPSGGIITATVVSQQLSGTTGTAASSSFTIAGTVGTVSSIQIKFDGVNWTEVLGATITFATDLTTMAAAIAQQLNTYVSGHVVSAISSGATITITLDSSLGAAQNNLQAQVTAAGGITVSGGIAPASFSLTANPSSLNLQIPQSRIGSVGSSITLTPKGGISPYLYDWTIGKSSNPAFVFSQNSANMTKNGYISIGITPSGVYGGVNATATCSFTCVVTDASVPTLQATITIVVTVIVIAG